MPKWTYDLTIVNDTDRPLKLVSQNVCWGKIERGRDNFPSCIQPGTSGNFRVYMPAGTSTGIEFYIELRDVPPKDARGYGTVRIGVDMPYWKHANTSHCNTTGELEEDGFTHVPDGAHDFSATARIYRNDVVH